MPNTMMGYGGVQPQRAVTPAMPIRQDYAGPLPQGGGLGATLPGYRPGMPVVDRGGRGVPLPPKLGGGMNYIGGSPNFDESLGAYRNPLKPMPDGGFMIPGPNDFSMGPGGAMTRYSPPAPPTLGITPIRGPFPTPPAPPTLGVTPIREPFPFPTQTPDQMQALRNAHLAQQQAQLLMAQQQPQLSAVTQQALPYIPPNAGIAALPMNPAMMQRLGTIASLAGGVRR